MLRIDTAIVLGASSVDSEADDGSPFRQLIEAVDRVLVHHELAARGNALRPLNDSSRQAEER